MMEIDLFDMHWYKYLEYRWPKVNMCICRWTGRNLHSAGAIDISFLVLRDKYDKMLLNAPAVR